jgi:hypothetical protein
MLAILHNISPKMQSFSSFILSRNRLHVKRFLLLFFKDSTANGPPYGLLYSLSDITKILRLKGRHLSLLITLWRLVEFVANFGIALATYFFKVNTH